MFFIFNLQIIKKLREFFHEMLEYEITYQKFETRYFSIENQNATAEVKEKA